MNCVPTLYTESWTRLWLDTSVSGTKVPSSRWMWYYWKAWTSIALKKKKNVNITEARYKCTLISEGCYLRLAHNDSNSKQKIMIQCEVQNLLWRFRGKWHLKSFNTERILKVLRTEGLFWGFKDIKKINAKSRL